MSSNERLDGGDSRQLDKLTQRVKSLEAENARLTKEVEAVNRDRVEYLQNVSHQLVAPLNAIKWHIENLTEGRLGVERAKKVLRSIYSQSTIAVHLAKNFALMSNLDADHALSALKEPLQPVKLFALLVNLADDFQPLGWDRGLQIGVSSDGFEDAPEALVMKPLISQVFSNIIENAVKYSVPNSSIRIEGSYDNDTDSVAIRVISRGIPFSPESQSRVFERGYRSPEAKSQYPAGTGFGLYIARRIVEIHQGEISAAGDAEGRAIFTVTLSVRGLEGKARQRDPKDRTLDRR